MEGEMHLLIIWEKGRYQQESIINDLKENFSIINCYEIEWSDKSVANNYTRFYGVNLPDRSFKEKACGRGKFLLFVLWDETPNYSYRKTSHGEEIVNIRLFDAKSKYRSWTGGGHKIHATNNPTETNHDLTLLLGINYEDYLSQHIGDRWNNRIIALKRDISGEHGWKSLKDFFYILNSTIQYVVLRGEENLEGEKLQDHGDVDLLVKEWKSAIYIMKGIQVTYPSPYRSKVLITTELEGEFLFDLWMSSLSYHSSEWHESMFKTRVNTGLYYRLNDENAFYSLLYHCLAHKKTTAPDYIPKLNEMYNRLELSCQFKMSQFKTPMDFYYMALQDYMNKHGYKWVYAKEDYYCFFNDRHARIHPALMDLRNRTQIDDIIPYMVSSYTKSGYIYFTGHYKGAEVFIKYGGAGKSCNNEIYFSSKISNYNSTNFLVPLLYGKGDEHDSFVVYEYVKGVPFTEIIHDKKLSGIILKQLVDIYNSLYACRIMHRDIRPDNFLYFDNRLVLIDFQFAIDFDNPRELKCLIDSRKIVMGIGDDFRYKRYCWNDYYSLIKMVESYGLRLDKSKLSLPLRSIWMSPKVICKNEICRMKSMNRKIVRKINSIFD